MVYLTHLLTRILVQRPTYRIFRSPRIPDFGSSDRLPCWVAADAVRSLRRDNRATAARCCYARLHLYALAFPRFRLRARSSAFWITRTTCTRALALQFTFYRWIDYRYFYAVLADNDAAMYSRIVGNVRCAVADYGRYDLQHLVCLTPTVGLTQRLRRSLDHGFYRIGYRTVFSRLYSPYAWLVRRTAAGRRPPGPYADSSACAYSLHLLALRSGHLLLTVGLRAAAHAATRTNAL